MKHFLIKVMRILLFIFPPVNCCHQSPDPLLADRRRLSVLPYHGDVKPLFEEFLSITSSPHQGGVNLPPLHQNVRLLSGNINDNWSPSYYQLYNGQDLHSLVYLRHALSKSTNPANVQDHLSGYTFVQLPEIKIWFRPESGDVVMYFPATIHYSNSDLYHVLTGHIDKRNGFAKYVQSAAKRNYIEFRKWLNDQIFESKINESKKFEIKSLKVYGHSRGAATADFFLFLGKNDVLKSVNDITLVRGSPLPSLGNPNHKVFHNVNVFNLVMVGDEFRDPYTRIKKQFYHPHGRNIFFRFEL